MLLDLTINGRPRKVITQAAKNGFFYVIDRVTGEFISGEPFVKVSWALGMGKAGRPIINPKAFYDQKDPIAILPTSGGGHNWSPMSYNPATGLVYIPSFYTTFPLQAQAEYKPGTTGYIRPRGDTRLVEPAYGPEPPPARARRTAGVGSGESETEMERRRRRRHRWRDNHDRRQPGVSGDQRRALPRDQRR